MTGNAVRFESFSCRHAGASSPAIRDVDLAIAEGEFVVVAGPSGSGKSTLLRSACGLMPGFDGGTASGRVVVGGLDTRDNPASGIGRVCGTVLQDPERQTVMATVRGEISLPLESRGFDAGQIAVAVEETALLVGIDALLDRKLANLSGGELQRVAIAAALAPGPRVLLLDEPVSQLDPVAADDICWLLRRINEEQGITVVVAEQRLERLLPGADRVVVLSEGRVAFDDSPEEFLAWAVGRAPALQTPAGSLFELAGLPAPPTSVKEARAVLAGMGLLPDAADSRLARVTRSARPQWSRRRGDGPALSIRGVWDEPKGSAPLLSSVDLDLAPGETVALMGSNGAGKTTLLRVAAGLREPTRGRVKTATEVAMLVQNPADLLIAERIGDLFDSGLLAAAGVAADPARHPRDLSGGERQWLAFELVARAAGEAGVILLDEPTRGLDRSRRADLAARIRELSRGGAAVMVATHDAELAAEVANRVVLLADGRVVADAAPEEVLAGGWHFTTETSRILGAGSRALLPAQGAELIAPGAEVGR